MKHSSTPITAEWILQQTLQRVAPLPSQEGYARALASILSMHIHRNQLIDDGIPADDLPTPSALVVAPTGQGKTYIFRKMSEILNQNTITIDCSTLTAEGWRGISLSNRLGSVKKELKDNRKFSRSLIFLDEFDKLHTWGTDNDQGNAARNILQMFNGSPIAIEIEKGTEHVDPSRFTIILGGAFSGLEDIVRERTQPVRIGFGNNASKPMSAAQAMLDVTVEDLQQYGFSPEILGRIGAILTIPQLGVEDYRQLLTASSGSLHQRYRNYFWNLYGCEFEITDAAVEAVSKRCMGSNTGARAANPIVNGLMWPAVAAVEEDSTICKVILDADTNGCVIRYDHGPRGYSFRDPARQQTQERELPWHTIRANNPAALTRTLLRYYRNSGNNRFDVEYQLERFLECAILFVYHQCRPSERTMDSLEKLARATLREGKSNSPFDIILSDARKVIPTESRLRFSSAYTPDLQRNLIDALQVIMTYIELKHGPCQVRFEIKNDNPIK